MQCILNLMPVFLDEFLIVVGHNTPQQSCLVVAFSLLAGNLQQQTLLQRPRSNTGGIESLQLFEHPFDGLHANVCVLTDVEFVADTIETLTQITVAVERTYEVFHDQLLLVGKLQLPHLFFQFVIERRRIAKHHLLVVGSLIGGIAENGRHFIITTDTCQCHLKGVLAIFALRRSSIVLL